MAQPELKTTQIYQSIVSKGIGGISDFEFVRFKRDIDSLKRLDATAAFDLMATLYVHREDFQSAIEQHQKALSLDPTAAILHNNYGSTLLRSNQSLNALDHLLHALEYKIDIKYRPSVIKQIMKASLNVLDFKTINEVFDKHEEEIMFFPEDKEKINQIFEIAKRTGTDKSMLERFSVSITTFFKKHNLEPVASQAIEDPEGGMFFIYDLPVSEEQMLEINDDYISFLMQTRTQISDLNAIFWCI